MVCPKCENGDIEKIRIKATGELFDVCSFCHSLWTEEEIVRFDTGHLLDFYLERQMKYSDRNIEENSQRVN